MEADEDGDESAPLDQQQIAILIMRAQLFTLIGRLDRRHYAELESLLTECLQTLNLK